MTIAIALLRVGTLDARIDPNRYGLRTVNAAGGSAATVAVRFTVRPVIVLVVDAGGTPTQLWTNLPGRPTATQMAALTVRRGDVRGVALATSRALLSAAEVPLAEASWGQQGCVWRR
jgi:hypothetical protein